MSTRSGDGNHIENALSILIKDLGGQLLHLKGAVGVGVFVEGGRMQEHLLQLGMVHSLDGLGITKDHGYLGNGVGESDEKSR